MTYVLIRESSIELLNAGGASAVWTAVIVVDVRMMLMIFSVLLGCCWRQDYAAPPRCHDPLHRVLWVKGFRLCSRTHVTVDSERSGLFRIIKLQSDVRVLDCSGPAA